jgi:hypothetical protein
MQSISGGFPSPLSFENQTDLRQGDGFAPPLFARAEGFHCLLIVGQGFRKMVLHIVDFAYPKQLVAVQLSSRRHCLEKPRLIERPRGDERGEEQSEQKP